MFPRNTYGLFKMSVAIVIIVFTCFGSDQVSTKRSVKMAASAEYLKKFPKVEHAVTGPDAWRFFAKMMRNKSLVSVPPHCGKCSEEQIYYCNTKVVSDHCCCDGNKNEVFPWIIHTCYDRAHPCKPFAKDCKEYAHTRDCCCKKILKDKWIKIRPVSPLLLKRLEEEINNFIKFKRSMFIFVVIVILFFTI